LQRVTKHSVLATSDILRTFLESPEKLDSLLASSSSTGTSSTTTAPAPTKSFFSFLSSAPAPSLPITVTVTEPDPWFDQKQAYLTKLESELTKLLQWAITLSNQLRDKAAAYGDFGKATGDVGACEKEDDLLAGSWMKFAELNDKIRILNNDLNGDKHELFKEVIEDWLRMIGSAKRVMSNRKDLLTAWKRSEKELITKKEKRDKIGPNGKGATQAKTEVEEAEKKEAKAKDDFEQISATVKKEMEWFISRKAKELHKLLRVWITSNLNAAVQTADSWKQMLNHLETGPAKKQQD